jgi:ankyrin repeat protein
MNEPKIISAIISNNLSEVQSLIKQGVNINQIWDGFTPLEYAIKLKNKRVKIARLLIENHANVSIYDKDSETVLEHLFVKFKNESATLSFLQSLPNIHITDDYEKNTALHYAARYNYTRCIDYLISNGANVNCINSQGQSPVFFAVDRGHDKSLELLCQNGANLNLQDTVYKKHWSPIFYAISNSDYRCVELLIRYGADLNLVDAEKLTPVFHAMQDSQLLQLLVGQGADLEFCNAYNRTPIFDAVATGNPQKVELLLNKGVNVDHADNLGWTPLLYAIERGNERIIFPLLERCKDINYKVEVNDISASSLAKRSKSPTIRALVESKIEQKILSSDVYVDKSAVSLCL